MNVVPRQLLASLEEIEFDDEGQTGYYTADSSGSTYHALGATRLVDSRIGLGVSSKLKAGVARTFQVTGHGGVPSDAVAVTGNLTMTGETASGLLFVGPVPTSHPSSWTLDVPHGQTLSGDVTVPLAASGKPGSLSVTYTGPTGATANVIFFVTGYYS